MDKLLNKIIQLFIVYFVFFLGVLAIDSVKADTSLSKAAPTVFLQTERPVESVSSVSVQKPQNNKDGGVRATPPPSSNLNQTQEPTPTQVPVDLFAQVALHSNASDCWMIIGGHVYNITSFFGSHPGGDPSLAAHCGTDATVAFNSKDKNPASPHSSSAVSMLASYLIQ